MCAIQLLIACLISFACSGFLDKLFLPPVTGTALLHAVISALPSILVAGVFSSGIAFTLQVYGQKHANPTAASIVMSLESVFGVIGGMIVLQERLSGREILGCILMFAAVMLAQLPGSGTGTETGTETEAEAEPERQRGPHE
jgi:drug/metabolite transporter (DMT)-like permease